MDTLVGCHFFFHIGLLLSGPACAEGGVSPPPSIYSSLSLSSPIRGEDVTPAQYAGDLRPLWWEGVTVGPRQNIISIVD